MMPKITAIWRYGIVGTISECSFLVEHVASPHVSPIAQIHANPDAVHFEFPHEIKLRKLRIKCKCNQDLAKRDHDDRT